MYIIVIAWLYITVLMAATETSLIAGVLTLFFYGLAPVGLFVWIFGTPARRRARMSARVSARSRLPQQTAATSAAQPESATVQGVNTDSAGRAASADSDSAEKIVGDVMGEEDRSHPKQNQ
jgi:hypothetical protein